MNKNDINQTTPQENKNKSQNREEDIREHKKTKDITHPMEPNTWIKNKHQKHTMDHINKITWLTCKNIDVSSPYDYRDPHAHKVTNLQHLPSFINQVTTIYTKNEAQILEEDHLVNNDCQHLTQLTL